ncbi:hypothetical protein S245_009690, partial [Arachis hypogaea]
MDMELSTTTLVLFILLAACGITQSLVVPIAKYSGVPNSDITQALTNAWREACASPTASKIVIPRGNEDSGFERALFNMLITLPYLAMVFLTVKNFGFNFMKHAVVRIITSKDSKNFNVNELGCQNFTFDGFKVIAPGNSLNTDGIHLGRSNGVRILNTDIAVGDDCISIDDGSVNTHIYNVKCGPGHGISVGSLGKYTTEAPVEGLILKKVTLTNTDNGLRIKSWPSAPGTSPISNLYYEDVTMINIRNPIIIDQEIALGTN